MKICLVAQNASLKFGGEASLPWLLFKHLRARGVDVRLVAHGRTAPEVLASFPEDRDRFHFAAETKTDRLIWRLGSRLPGKIDAQTFTILRHIFNQYLQRQIVCQLIADQGIQIVHEINPVSPRQLSLMYGLGVPVVIGPLAGGMTYPTAFADMESLPERIVEAGGRAMSQLLNRLWPGKRRADALIVANDQARAALPAGTRGKIFFIPDVGVDLTVWGAGDSPPRNDGKIRFVYLGRLADWKGVKFLIEAFATVVAQMPAAHLDILGDGERRAALQDQTRQLNLSDRITFTGWVSAQEGAQRLRNSDVLVLPSLHEVGGIVILEAMAAGLPVIATDWGGPSLHVTDETGIRVPPNSRQGFVKSLSDAMLRLANSPELRQSMAQAGRRRVTGNLYDWGSKTDRFLEIYAELLDPSKSRNRQAAEV
jgi:glycosyltransferase involved in cell wall biosynthesis